MYSNNMINPLEPERCADSLSLLLSGVSEHFSFILSLRLAVTSCSRVRSFIKATPSVHLFERNIPNLLDQSGTLPSYLKPALLQSCGVV